MAQAFDWKERFQDRITTAREAVKQIHSGNSIFIGTGCAQPQHLVRALAEHSKHIYDAHIIHMLTVGDAPYADEQYRERFKMNSFFVADNVRHALEQGFGDYTPIFLSEIPDEFESGPHAHRRGADQRHPAGRQRTVQLRRLGGHHQIRGRQRQDRHRPGQHQHAAHARRQLHPRKHDRHARAVRRAARDRARARADGSAAPHRRRTSPASSTTAARSSAASAESRRPSPSSSRTRRSSASTPRCSATGSST